tara:strand:- start:290 stop:499 length:210 start_codon:yes stop_codon:yes gene_type:complete
MKNVRFEMVMSEAEAETLARLAASANRSKGDVMRDAIGMMDAVDRRKPGQYVGLSRDREAIDVVLIGAR